jgi:hypothetical protein
MDHPLLGFDATPPASAALDEAARLAALAGTGVTERTGGPHE